MTRVPAAEGYTVSTALSSVLSAAWTGDRRTPEGEGTDGWTNSRRGGDERMDGPPKGSLLQRAPPGEVRLASRAKRAHAQGCWRGLPRGLCSGPQGEVGVQGSWDAARRGPATRRLLRLGDQGRPRDSGLMITHSKNSNKQPQPSVRPPKDKQHCTCLTSEHVPFRERGLHAHTWLGVHAKLKSPEAGWVREAQNLKTGTVIAPYPWDTGSGDPQIPNSQQLKSLRQVPGPTVTTCGLGGPPAPHLLLLNLSLYL